MTSKNKDQFSSHRVVGGRDSQLREKIGNPYKSQSKIPQRLELVQYRPNLISIRLLRLSTVDNLHFPPMMTRSFTPFWLRISPFSMVFNYLPFVICRDNSTIQSTCLKRNVLSWKLYTVNCRLRRMLIKGWRSLGLIGWMIGSCRKYIHCQLSLVN